MALTGPKGLMSAHTFQAADLGVPPRRPMPVEMGRRREGQRSEGAPPGPLTAIPAALFAVLRLVGGDERLVF